MCDGMKIAKRLMLIGVIIIVLSMTMATQYTSTRIGYSYSIVHPSDSDIRFIASDNSSDGVRVLRLNGDNATGMLELYFGGNISTNQNKTYTAAFGIVNEEQFAVNITHFNVTSNGSGAADQYLQIWLHGNRSAQKESDPNAVKVWDNGSDNNNGSAVWVLGAGNANPGNMCDNNDHDGGQAPQILTPFDSTAMVRYSTNNDNDSMSGISDFVWVQVSLNIPATADVGDTYTGTIFIFTRAGT
jgi:hypothetical protein